MNFEQKDKSTQRKIENTLAKFKELKQLYDKNHERLDELKHFLHPLFEELKPQKGSNKPLSLSSNYSFVIGNTTHHLKKGSGAEEVKKALELVSTELERLKNTLIDINEKLESRVKRLETLIGMKREEFFDE